MINSLDVIYILSDLNINFFLNNSDIWKKRISWIASHFRVMLKPTMNFVQFLDESN